MNIEELRDFCLALKGVTEHFPFDEKTLVFKVGGKMFCLTDLEKPFFLNLKNDPEKNVELRERYACVRPGYHMNKRHWNTLVLDGSLTPKLVRELCDHSYALVVAKLPKRDREGLV